MIITDLFESHQQCPECGGPAFSDLILAEKKDACYYKVKASAKVWPSAYASGRLVQCRKKGADNYGKSKNEGVAEGAKEDMSKEAKAMASGKCPHCHGPVEKKEHPTLTQYHCAKCGIRASIDKQGVAEEQLDEKCWDGYQQQGTKNKGGRQVPNCVPTNEDSSQDCPPATQDIKLNLKNRQKAIDEYGYGPLNPDMPNRKFWMAKQAEWKLDSPEEAKQSLCGNCAAFDQRTDTLDCIAQGIGSDQGADDPTIDAGDLGYCRFLKFKCASRRTCDAWVTGGPLIDKPAVAEDQLAEKSVSKAQFRTMAAAAHNPKFAKKVGISPAVAKEFHSADKSSNYKKLPDRTNEEGERGRGRPMAGDWDPTSGKVGRVEKTPTGVRHHADPSRYGGTENDPELDRLDKGAVNKMDNALGVKWDRESKRYFSPIKVDETKPKEKEVDYGDDYQNMVARVKKLAGLGPLKTVYDPQKRVYRNVPTAVQPKK